METGDPLVLVESIKIGIAIFAASQGVGRNPLVKSGQTVTAVDLVMALEEK